MYETMTETATDTQTPFMYETVTETPSETPTAIVPDLNQDGQVDAQDLLLMLEKDTMAIPVNSDLNRDWKTDAMDFFLFLQWWGKMNPGNPGWHWNENGNVEGWNAMKGLGALAVSEGCLKMTSTSSDPILFSPSELQIDGMNQKKIIIRARISAGSFAELFYRRSTDADFSGTRKKRFDITSNTEFVTYSLDMNEDPQWSEFVTRLRLDPTEVSGAVIDLDYVVVP